MKLRFTKMQGAGNDFVVLDATRQPMPLTSEQLRRVGDRRFGVGCDQILVIEAAKAPGIDFGYRTTAQPGTGPIGYWKNHAEAWPVQQITVGGVTYTKAQAISLMGQPGKGDKTIDLYKQLVASMLNVILGNEPSCIRATIDSANAWLTTYPVGSKVKSSSAAWIVGGPLHTTLDTYNNGNLCAPHRD